MIDLFASDEIPEADRAEQELAFDDSQAQPGPAVGAESWSADEGDLLEQSIELPEDDDHDYDG